MSGVDGGGGSGSAPWTPAHSAGAWYAGKVAKISVVKELVNNLNIHGAHRAVPFRLVGAAHAWRTVRACVLGLRAVDNLCVFLAQEKVVQFAKLNPRQLLEETEKAANIEYVQRGTHPAFVRLGGCGL